VREDALAAPAAVSTPAGHVPDVVGPPPRHPRFPLVDGLRAIAVLAVVGVHAGEFGGAWGPSLGGRLLAHLNVGVTIFFVISGLLLYRPFIAHRGGGATAPATRDYGKRRFLRIYPAYWLVLSFLVLAPGLTGVVNGQWLPMYTLTHTLGLGSSPSCSQLVTRCDLAQTWSLVVEVTFYLALPVYAWASAWLTRRLGLRGWVVGQLGLLAGLSAASVLLSFVILDPAPTWLVWSVVGNVFWFSLGMGLAVVSVALEGGAIRFAQARAFVRWPEAAWALALLAYLALSLALPATPYLFDRGQLLAVHVVFGLIALLLVSPAVLPARAGALTGRLLAHRTIAWLGTISYGIFLWHYTVALKLGSPGSRDAFVVVLVGTLAISILCATASYYLLERPLLRLKYRSIFTPGASWKRSGRGGPQPADPETPAGG
jgi:peptidoglycan/LPS O-acetylase OafA/YrhL